MKNFLINLIICFCIVGCSSVLLDEINKLHHEIKAIPKFQNKTFYVFIE
jgi:uncharacterized protein YceK